MMVKLIKSESDYRETLARVDELMDAEEGTPEADELEVLATLAELYEKIAFPIGFPDPIGAIKFRMDQMGLRQADLIPFIGSRSRVSEVLSGKRPLTLKMIRALHERLGIPADALLQQQGATLPDEAGLDVSRFPWGAMLKHNWFPGFNGTARDAKEHAEELLSKLFSSLSAGDLQIAHYRGHVRSGSEMDSYALLVWRARVVSLAKASPLPSSYKKGIITKGFMSRLVQLSYLDEGPKLAREFLHKNGIHLIIERHLPKTHLDGAATILDNGTPVVAMTLRHDRLDNFWFCLCHELGHVTKHLTKPDTEWFFDDLDLIDGDEKEHEADEWAEEALIPSSIWEAAPAHLTRAVSDVRKLAEKIRIHPAIIAGRIRWETKNYRILSRQLGQGEVRKHFAEEMSD